MKAERNEFDKEFTDLLTASSNITSSHTALTNANSELNEAKAKQKLDTAELDKREKRKVGILKQEVHDRDVHIIVVKKGADAQVRTLVEEVAARDVSLGRHRNGDRGFSSLVHYRGRKGCCDQMAIET